MSDVLLKFITITWTLIAEMAPYLLFGFAVASILHCLLHPDQIKKYLGQPGFKSVIKSTLIGIPMPLCSCSVIPVASSLRKSGATRGATASFLSATPQTGVDSILATYALMGGPFATVRVLVALISGCLSGFLIERLVKEPVIFKPPQSTPPTVSSCCSKPQTKRPSLFAGLRHGFLTLTSDLAPALFIGLILAGLLSTFLPQDWLGTHFHNQWLAFTAATLISLPLYICATASIPMAYALVAAGLSPSAALIFLIVGPATNSATVVAAWKLLGHKATLLYLITLVSIAWLAGFAFDVFLSQSHFQEVIHDHETTLSLWQHMSGFILCSLLVGAYLLKKRASKRKCCAN